MLTPERHQLIIDEIEKHDVVKIQYLMNLTKASESTIRRDLSTLEARGYLKRVHGGASRLSDIRKEPDMLEKSSKNLHEKKKIAKEAASLLEEGDCIYLDAGTTTLQMIDFIDQEKDIIVVTNGVMHIEALIKKGITFYLLGGHVKHKTGAIVGGSALTDIGRYRFDKSFIGVNGIHKEAGFTTPDPEEALLKTKAVKQAKKPLFWRMLPSLGKCLFCLCKFRRSNYHYSRICNAFI